MSECDWFISDTLRCSDCERLLTPDTKYLLCLSCERERELDRLERGS
jgi:hypothetical protein